MALTMVIGLSIGAFATSFRGGMDVRDLAVTGLTRGFVNGLMLGALLFKVADYRSRILVGAVTLAAIATGCVVVLWASSVDHNIGLAAQVQVHAFTGVAGLTTLLLWFYEGRYQFALRALPLLPIAMLVLLKEHFTVPLAGILLGGLLVGAAIITVHGLQVRTAAAS